LIAKEIAWTRWAQIAEDPAFGRLRCPVYRHDLQVQTLLRCRGTVSSGTARRFAVDPPGAEER
jgi:hypothetical protein